MYQAENTKLEEIPIEALAEFLVRNYSRLFETGIVKNSEVWNPKVNFSTVQEDRCDTRLST